MATIAPTGTITLYHDVPFTNNYAHSIYFANRTAQASYFSGKKLGDSLTAQNYVKTENGRIRVEKNNNDIDDACYMSWKNGMVGATAAHVFYAFILNIDLVSANVVEITYEVDVLQTYLIGRTGDDGILGQCLIERRTPGEDEIGDHLEPEPLGFGDYKLKYIYKFLQGNDAGDPTNGFLVFSAFKFSDIGENSDWKEMNICYPQIVGGLLQGLYVYYFDTAAACSNAIGGLRGGLAEAIISVVNVPTGFITSQNDHQVTNRGIPTDDVCFSRQTNDIDGYSPKYNKLFTYPYNLLQVTNNEGNAKNYRWEYFEDTQMEGGSGIAFKLALSITPDPELIAIPRNYRGIDEDYDSRVTLSGFAKASWMSSYYNEWLHSYGVQGTLGLLGGSFFAGMSGQRGTLESIPMYTMMGDNDPIYEISKTGKKADYSWAKNSALGAAALGSEMAKAQTHPNGFSGSYAGQTALAAYHKKNIFAYQVCINSEDAKRIDDFFTRFGYAINRIQIPLGNGMVSSRNQLYIKTAGCIVKEGRCPAEFARRIEQIFNTGITWWKPGKVGEYN